MKNLKRNIKVGKIKTFLLIVFLFSQLFTLSHSNEFNVQGNFLEIKVLDKVSSKNYKLNIKIGEEKIFKNILIKPLKCKNSEFDDNPEITAYIQVSDLTKKDKDDVFVFNGWMFSSSPSITPFDHPVYDIWLVSCY